MSCLKTTLCAFMALWTCNTFAQQDLMQYIGQSTPQSIYVNPAFTPDVRMNFGLPFLSSVSMHHTNFIFNPNDLFENADQGTRFRTQNYLDLIEERNSAGVEMAIDVLSFGLKVKESYFTFMVREKMLFHVNLPGDLLRLPVTGNADFSQNNGLLDFSGLSVDFSHHVEYGLGWRKMIGEKTALGARAKFLFGRESMKTVRSDVKWQTDPETFEYTFTGGLDINTSGVAYIIDSLDGNGFLENGEVAQYLFQFRNGGFGVDLGVDHQLTEKLSLSASVIDFGFINWNNGNRNYKTSGEEFVFSGIEITEAIIGSEENFGDSLSASVDDAVQSLADSYEFNEDTEKYRTPLNTRIYLGAEYDVLDHDNMDGTAGLLFHSAFYRGEWTPTVSLSYRHEFGSWLTTQVAYSVMKEDAKNIGFGLSLQGGPTQFYFSLDNLFAMNLTSIRTNADDTPSGYPSTSTNATLRFGFNYFLLHKEKKTEENPQSKF